MVLSCWYVKRYTGYTCFDRDFPVNFDRRRCRHTHERLGVHVFFLRDFHASTGTHTPVCSCPSAVRRVHRRVKNIQNVHVPRVTVNRRTCPYKTSREITYERKTGAVELKKSTSSCRVFYTFTRARARRARGSRNAVTYQKFWTEITNVPRQQNTISLVDTNEYNERTERAPITRTVKEPFTQRTYGSNLWYTYT